MENTNNNINSNEQTTDEINYFISNPKLVKSVLNILSAAKDNPENQVFGYQFRENKQFENEPCWLTKTGSTKDYKMVTADKRKYLVHRTVYSIIKNNGKEIPNNLIVRHLCNQPNCINPNHLALGTQKDNCYDRMIHTPFYPSKTKKLTQEQSKEIKNLYFIHQLTQQEIAEIYNISRRNISKIVNGITWTNTKTTEDEDFIKQHQTKFRRKEDCIVINRKLTDQQAKDIKRKFFQENKTQTQIAKEYNVSISTVGQIVRNVTYKD